MQLFRIIPLEKDLWAIYEIDKTVMFVINGTERALLLDTGLGLTDLKEEVLKLCGEKSLIVVNTHAHVDHNISRKHLSLYDLFHSITYLRYFLKWNTNFQNLVFQMTSLNCLVNVCFYFVLIP